MGFKVMRRQVHMVKSLGGNPNEEK